VSERKEIVDFKALVSFVRNSPHWDAFQDYVEGTTASVNFWRWTSMILGALLVVIGLVRAFR